MSRSAQIRGYIEFFKIQKHVAAVSIVLCVSGLGSYRDNVFVK